MYKGLFHSCSKSLRHWLNGPVARWDRVASSQAAGESRLLACSRLAWGDPGHRTHLFIIPKISLGVRKRVRKPAIVISPQNALNLW